MRKSPPIPYPLNIILHKFGSDIRSARIVRRITLAQMAEIVSISKPTLCKVEKGDPSVAFGVYVHVIYELGLDDRVSNLVNLTHKNVDLEIVDVDLPKRVRHKKVINITSAAKTHPKR